MISLHDVLLAMSNLPVDDPIAEIWGRQMQGRYKISEYTDALPITINANGDALLDYRIYGADGGVGEQAESGEPAGYKLPMTVQSANLMDMATNVNGYIDDGGNLINGGNSRTTDFIAVLPEKLYVAKTTATISGAAIAYRVCYYTANKKFIQRNLSMAGANEYDFKPPSNVYYIRISMISSIETATSVMARTIIPVYIGAEPLGEDEYVSFKEQKVYRKSSELWDGILYNSFSSTISVKGIYSTDPPIPLPEIPTIDGTTIIDYDGEPKPSQVYVKYKE